MGRLLWWLGGTIMMCPAAANACDSWRMVPQLVMRDANGLTVAELSSSGNALSGPVQRFGQQDVGRERTGTARGSFRDGSLWLRVAWADGGADIYEGRIGNDGRVSGAMSSVNDPQRAVAWTSSSPLDCAGGESGRRGTLETVVDILQAATDAYVAVAGARPPVPAGGPAAYGNATDGGTLPPAPAEPASAGSASAGSPPVVAEAGESALPPAPDGTTSGFDPNMIEAGATPDPGPPRVPAGGGASPPFIPIIIRPTACPPGQVWREARPSDRVCVSPAAHARVREENRMALSRRALGGPHGPDTCRSGFVWREAYGGDRVCVPPASRDLARGENRLASRHSAN